MSSKLLISLLTIVNLIFFAVPSSFAYEDIGDTGWVVTVPGDEEVLQRFGEPALDFLNPNSIKFLSWNIYKSKMVAFEDRFNELRKGHDILALQEMYLDDKFMDMIDGDTKREYFGAVSFFYHRRIGAPSTGVMTASVARAEEVDWRRSPLFEPVSGTPKMALLKTYRLMNSNEKLLVVNIHAINFRRAFALRMQIDELFETVKHHDGPVIFAGDFNAWNKAKQSYLFNKMKEHELVKAEFADNQYRTRFRGYALDYIFYRGLNLLRAQVLNTYDASDHAALKAEFSW